MIQAVSPTLIVRGASILVFALSVGVLWFLSPDSAAELWGLKGLILAVPSLLVFVLTVRPVFRWVHRATFASRWLFPDLDGEWVGELHSNWPRIRALMDAAEGTRPPFNALSSNLPQEEVGNPIRMEATIKSGLVDFEVVMRLSPTRRSYTVFAKPTWCKPSAPRLYYVFVQNEIGAIAASDVSEHRGAAYLDYDPDTDVLHGRYWTERNADRGINTAGHLILRRVRVPIRTGWLASLSG